MATDKEVRMDKKIEVMAKVDAFVHGPLAAKLAAYYKAKFPTLEAPKLTVTYGGKYAKVVKDNGTQKTVYFFVNLENADILKAATWHAPAKGARGNLADGEGVFWAVGPYGAKYLVGPELGWEGV